MKTESKKSNNDTILYNIYLGLWGNLDTETQVEFQPLSYTDFKKVNNKSELIDTIKTMIYNK